MNAAEFQNRVDVRFAWTILGRAIDQCYDEHGVYLHIFCYSHVGLPQSRLWRGVWCQHPVPEPAYALPRLN